MCGGALLNSLQGICRDCVAAVSYEFVLLQMKVLMPSVSVLRNSIVVLLHSQFDGLQ